MTLPHGFGSNYAGRCNQNNCDGHISKKGGYCDNLSCPRYTKPKIPLRAKFDDFTRMHYEAWAGIKTILLLTIIVVGGILLGPTLIDFEYSLGEADRDIIDGLNCSRLAEYVADWSPEYDYADHRYEWLCVNEQVKEFQG